MHTSSQPNREGQLKRKNRWDVQSESFPEEKKLAASQKLLLFPEVSLTITSILEQKEEKECSVQPIYYTNAVHKEEQHPGTEVVKKEELSPLQLLNELKTKNLIPTDHGPLGPSETTSNYSPLDLLKKLKERNLLQGVEQQVEGNVQYRFSVELDGQMSRPRVQKEKRKRLHSHVQNIPFIKPKSPDETYCSDVIASSGTHFVIHRKIKKYMDDLEELRSQGFPPPGMSAAEPRLSKITEYKSTKEKFRKQKAGTDAWDRIGYGRDAYWTTRNIEKLLRKRPELCNVCKFKLDSPGITQEMRENHIDQHVKDKLKQTELRMRDLEKETNENFKWFPSPSNWLSRKPEQVEEKVENVNSEGLKKKKCPVCREVFTDYYDHEEDAWKLKDSTQINGKAVHVYCSKDLENSEGNTAGSTAPVYTID